uniref:Uncharacterized protein n=1 Tax=Phlebotomus papatasi TaxID=29031 RepID=A0A1B0DLE7_PHLPP
MFIDDKQPQVSGYCSEGADRDRSMSGDSAGLRLKGSRRMLQQQSTQEEGLSWIPEASGPVIVQEQEVEEATTVEVEPQPQPAEESVNVTNAQDDSFLAIPQTIATSSSADTLTETTTLSGPGSPSNLSSVTLVGSTGSGGQEKTDITPTEGNVQFKYGKAPTSPLPERVNKRKLSQQKEREASTTAPDIIPIISPPTVTTTPCITTQASHEEIPRSKGSFSSAAGSSGGLKVNLLMDRRPSAGANVIPQAALCQHRYSLQLNGDGGIYRGERSSPRMIHRVPKTPEKQKKSFFGTPQREPPRLYKEQLEVLVSCFLRPFKMAASSKRPPCSHEDVNSIFLNSETVLFLHQIFLKGLTSRLESWPTLVLGDLFDMLLPMLSIYQEYVRNHHYSLQVLTECKSNPAFATVLKRLEAKSVCQGRSLETFLTYPMHQIPRYIITLHELLAHTPHDHVERKSLQNARQQLEDLSRQMHDEVSETENLRKNLAVERMIVEGCDILLDVNQVFVRQGSLVQVPPGRGRIRSRLASFKSEREAVRQCFLFSNHMIIATRTSGGRLHLLQDVGKIPLADATLVEDPSDSEREDEGDTSVCSASNQGSCLSVNDSVNASHRDFKLIVENKTGLRHCIHLVAPTVQDKEAWISDISQCLDNIHMHSMLSPGLGGSIGGGSIRKNICLDYSIDAFSRSGSLAAHHALRADPRLFKDDVDIRFSRTLNSCKLPQVRYATPERLLQRLTDLRFLSIDFLNTFLLTYRVFTDGETVLNALKKVFYDPPTDPQCDCEPQTDFLDIPSAYDGRVSPRRTSGASSLMIRKHY